MKMKCIKDFYGMNLLTVGKIYDVKEEAIGYYGGITIYRVTNDHGMELKLSDKTLGIYFEKADTNKYPDAETAKLNFDELDKIMRED